MRITRESLLSIARETVAQKLRVDRQIVAVYLTGSMLGDDPSIGGAGDVDLFFVHNSEPAYPREIIRITDEATLDIAHLNQSVFRQPRRLRADAWLGTFITEHPLVLHDTGHWFEFIQASLSAQFNQPENVLQRARALSALARTCWTDMQSEAQTYPRRMLTYLKGLENAANAAAVISGAPLTERRFMTGFPERAEALGHAGLYDGLASMLAPQPPAEDAWPGWLDAWKAALTLARSQDIMPVRLSALRQVYYEHAIKSQITDLPASALWMLWRTWTLAVCYAPAGTPPQEEWLAACDALGLAEQNFAERVSALDAYLDTVDEALDDWGNEKGVAL